MKILLADPDEYYHSRFAEILGDFGEIFSSHSVEDAARLLRANRPDVLITELLLSDAPGYRLLEEVAALGHPPIPVIIFSQIAEKEDIEASLNLGVTAYFVKGQDTLNDVRKLLLNYHT